MDKLITKKMALEEAKNLPSRFNLEDLKNLDDKELIVLVSNMSILIKELADKIPELEESSGINDINTDIANIKMFEKNVLDILASRKDAAVSNDKSLVSFNDTEVSFDDNGNEVTTEVVTDNVYVEGQNNYIILDFTEHNILANDSEGPEGYLESFIRKLRELNLLSVVSFGKATLGNFVNETIDDMLDKAHEWHTFNSTFTISKAKLNTALNASQETAEELINSCFIKLEVKYVSKKATSKQMNLFTDFEDEEINIEGE